MTSVAHLSDYALEARANRKSQLEVDEYIPDEEAKVSAYLGIQQEEEILLPHAQGLKEYLRDNIYKQ